jgi:branched-chain amino acid transport system ATP-binding protein
MLEIKDLCAGYDGMKVVHGVCLEVNEGELVSLLGANGVGKTTLVRCISGINKISSGKVTFMGSDITHATPESVAELGISQVPEGRHLFSRMTVRENLEMGCYVKRARGNKNKNLEYIYSLFPELKEMEKKPAGNLSGGQQQMVAIGRALMAEPRLLILDEPSIGLSPVMTQTVFRIVEQIRKDGVAVLISEQNAEEVLAMADRAYVMQQGSIVLSGNACDIKNDDKVRQAYLGI